jgi:lysophospholipase L1-like esterase
VPSWADQLQSDRKAKVLVNLGVSGATAEGFNSVRTLDRQVDDWVARHKSKGLPDRTVIYFGYNDIDNFRPLGAAMNHYRIALDRLIAQGLARGSRRILLCQLHDWSRNPAQTRNSVARVKSWNQFLRSLAAERTNVVTVDLYARFEHVAKNKKTYGFTHVTVADKARSASTHLYFDGNHFGKKGQALIAKEIAAKLK